MPDRSAPVRSSTVDKRALRAELRESRRSLADESRQRLDAAINRAVVEFAVELGATTIAGFRAFDGEPNLASALAHLAATGKRLVLPVLAEQPGGTRLQFRAWDTASALMTNRFGIAEPRAGQPVPVEQIDLVLVPLVGWDRHGGRLGMGAGYYDRALADVAGAARPVRAGIAYTVQRVEQVPTDPHDVPLHFVITEEGRFTCSS